MVKVQMIIMEKEAEKILEECRKLRPDGKTRGLCFIHMETRLITNKATGQKVRSAYLRAIEQEKTNECIYRDTIRKVRP